MNPHRLKENIKTFALTILVIVSVVFSVIVWNGTPTDVVVGRSHFFSSPLYGHERLVSDFVKPSAIWIWTNDNELFRLSGESQTAQAILESLQQAQVQSQGMVNQSTFTIPPSRGPYIALDFGQLLSDGSLWSYALPTFNANDESFASGLIYLTPGSGSGKWSVYFQTQEGVYRIQLKDVSPALASALTPNDESVPYAQLTFDHQIVNLPYDSLTMRTQTWILADPSPMPIVNSFFRDPSLIQSLSINPKTSAYTDGTREVQLIRHSLGFELYYQAPEFPLKGYHETSYEALSEAVPFLDSHGGFVGHEVLQEVLHYPKLGKVQLLFCEEDNGWPLFSELNRIAIHLTNGEVSQVQRLLPYLQSEVAEQEVHILSGAQLLQVLKSLQMQDVHSITLGYGSKLETLNEVQLVPVYRVVNGTDILYFNARTGKLFHGMGM